jgi:hypothetical protein
VELLKRAQEIKTAGMGGLLHDGWTKAGNHLLGVFAAYLRKMKQVSTLAKRMKHHQLHVQSATCAQGKSLPGPFAISPTAGRAGHQEWSSSNFCTSATATIWLVVTPNG